MMPATGTATAAVAAAGTLQHQHAGAKLARLDRGADPGDAIADDDDIGRVLDYRKVRQIIIDECTAEHVNLLETLIGKLTHRLMQLPAVVGTRVKIAKLEIFTDCEVAIRMEAGQW